MNGRQVIGEKIRHRVKISARLLLPRLFGFLIAISILTFLQIIPGTTTIADSSEKPLRKPSGEEKILRSKLDNILLKKVDIVEKEAFASEIFETYLPTGSPVSKVNHFFLSIGGDCYPIKIGNNKNQSLNCFYRTLHPKSNIPGISTEKIRNGEVSREEVQRRLEEALKYNATELVIINVNWSVKFSLRKGNTEVKGLIAKYGLDGV